MAQEHKFYILGMDLEPDGDPLQVIACVHIECSGCDGTGGHIMDAYRTHLDAVHGPIVKIAKQEVAADRVLAAVLQTTMIHMASTVVLTESAAARSPYLQSLVEEYEKSPKIRQDGSDADEKGVSLSSVDREWLSGLLENFKTGEGK